MSTGKINTTEAALLLGISSDGVRKLRERGEIGGELDDSGHPPRWLFERADVEALRDQRIKDGEQNADDEPHLAPRVIEYLRALWNMGAVVASESGQATGLIHARMQGGYGAATSVARELLLFGLIETEMRGKRTYRVALTPKGLAYCRGTFPPPPEPEPEQPEPVATQLAVLDAPSTSNGASAPTVEPPPQAPDAPAPPPTTVPELGVDVNALAQALLRQTTRVLADSELASVVAERDALREHNRVLAERLGVLTRERDGYASEAREAREVLHGIEMQLTPLLAGPEARFDWLDARTRTDLIRLVSEAARWAGAPTA